MSYSIVFNIEALIEYQEASLWYENQLDGLGLKFENAVESKLAQLCNDPYMYPIKKKTFRQTAIYKFPFLIVYKVNKVQKIVSVTAIFHGSRNPRKKYRD